MKLFSGILSVSVAALCMGGCSDNATSGLSDISSLPVATGSVSSSGSAILKPVASTGVILKNLSDVTWSGKSRALCEAGAITKNALRETARNDKIQCYIGVMEANNLFNASYDGTDKYYTLPSEDETMKIKFNIASAGGAITSFKMWTCEDGSTQSQYLSTTNTNNAVSITSVMSRSFTFDSVTGSFGNRATVTGTVNSSGAWLSKDMTVSMRRSHGVEDSSEYSSISQGASTITISAFRSGTYSSSAFSTQVYGISEILNAGSLTTFALGDGSMKYAATFPGDTSASGTVSWTGDDMLALSPASSGTYYSSAAAGTLPTVATQTISFDSAAGEAWDCAADAGGFTAISAASFTADLESQLAVCDAKYAGDTDRRFIDCHGGDD